ncbi:hypothetical protein [Beggiatoa leptomitoformis]|uniref:Uncharacterized protein n=1 Tax=Beggiatoa leptomitoformis TaxID=288004 RepID=A0A2N9Y9X6_9GAMM|nr:hypothetical protein [Beggiatoa leptomitoformis]AUI67262.1 hypothetical protein BLE401_00175 [Beggiatoa leptomitoformis]QGX03589.1 hypothetical protein AL038_05800 [Beggiatoa leptomitoformis]
MSNPDLAFYLNKFTKLRVDKTKQGTMSGNAPHKPVLLISVIELIEKRVIKDNRIYLTPDLQQLFEENWRLLVTTENICQLINPFFHLKNEGFWYLVAQEDHQATLNTLKTISSFKKLTTLVAYAKLKENLFNLLLQTFACQELKYLLLQHYFPETMQNYLYK